MMADIVKQDTGKRGKPNIPAAEWKMIRTLLGYSVGYNISYKMQGPVLYSCCLRVFECSLFSAKCIVTGTCEVLLAHMSWC